MRHAAVGVICLGIMMFATARAAAQAPAPNPFDAPAPDVSGLVPLPPSGAPPAPGIAPPSAATGVSSSLAAIVGHGVAASRCTIAVITEDTGTNDTFLSRMTFRAPASPASANAALMCPADAAPAAARRALQACKRHAVNPYNCVYADTDHQFDASADAVDSSSTGSQCASSASRFIAIACERGWQQDDCNIACADTQAAATDAAQTKCRATHGGDCAMVNAAPVQAP
jgi:hypothetical protein